jgi:hypothetical protein
VIFFGGFTKDATVITSNTRGVIKLVKNTIFTFLKYRETKKKLENIQAEVKYSTTYTRFSGNDKKKR